MNILKMKPVAEKQQAVSGYYLSPSYKLIEVYGVDAARFINAQTTSDVKALQPFQSQPSALLDRKAHVVAYFNLYRKNSSFRIVAEENQIAAILEHLNKYIFSDKVELLDLSNEKCLALIGSEARPLIYEKLAVKNADIFERDLIDGQFAGVDVHIFRAPLSSKEAFLIYCAADQFATLQDNLKDALQQHKFKEFTAADMLIERVEAGLPVFGVDFDSDNLIIELGLEDSAISYTKGCFQGQEVLARVKGHGSPNKQLGGLLLDLTGEQSEVGSASAIALDIKPGTPVMVAGVEAAKILSNVYSPTLKRRIALALIKRDYRTPDRVMDVTVGELTGKATVRLLPFISTEDLQKKAKDLYQEALKLYASTDKPEEKTAKAIANLRTALLLDSRMEDAYEALGVILSKENQIDEAVTLMETLARINPDSVMAYANLSVFYLEQGGGKEKAEDAKAQSMSIRMRLAAKEAMQEHKQKEDTEKIEAEALQRKEMFEQVIEIDPDDLFANNGLGNCYNILQQYDKAEPYLLKAITIKANHTVAYQELGRTYEGLNLNDKAIATYKTGIDVAAQKGDMTPLKAMQVRLAELTK